ncbi:contact-dependent growth inhibition system immunity protein [Streptomyces sp. NBC_00105]|uniref:contact-dependent growth inhibition system immunity protein n=1 Tax=unclassified Streptomyces TaxID=2593676 RepID=UPI0028883FFF|nr:contact-dependent growth inhibition system immunity protein [Streptomyces sp. DSM 41633]
MNIHFERSRTIEELEGQRWPDPPPEATGLVRSVHRLRKRPIGDLTAYELGRLIGQDIALPWTLPLALEILHETAANQSRGGFYDDDLLSAALTRGPDVWVTFPEPATKMREILAVLTDLSPCIKRDVSRFLEASQGRD